MSHSIWIFGTQFYINLQNSFPLILMDTLGQWRKALLLNATYSAPYTGLNK